MVICHVLKRKGYRCTTEAQDGEEEECVEEEEKDLEMGGGEEGVEEAAEIKQRVIVLHIITISSTCLLHL